MKNWQSIVLCLAMAISAFARPAFASTATYYLSSADLVWDTSSKCVPPGSSSLGGFNSIVYFTLAGTYDPANGCSPVITTYIDTNCQTVQSYFTCAASLMYSGTCCVANSITLSVAVSSCTQGAQVPVAPPPTPIAPPPTPISPPVQAPLAPPETAPIPSFYEAPISCSGSNPNVSLFQCTIYGWYSSADVNATTLSVDSNVQIAGNLTTTTLSFTGTASLVTLSGCADISGSVMLNLTQSDVDALSAAATTTTLLKQGDFCSSAISSLGVTPSYPSSCKKVSATPSNTDPRNTLTVLLSVDSSG